MSWKDRPAREQDIEVKERFAEYYQEVLGEEYETFMTCNKHYLQRAIRINTLKADVEDVTKRLRSKGWTLTSVPWCPEGFWMSGDRLDIGNTLEHQLGYFYVQDPASMLPPVVLDAKPGETVLDMCASPGSKTTQLAAMMKNTGVIVANESDGPRLAPLGVNIQKLGVTNVVVTKRDGRRVGGNYDKVLIDVPCTGTGTIRRSLKSIEMFNEESTKGLANLQLGLLQHGYDILKSNGTLTYSTCSLDPTENEAVVSAFLSDNPWAEILPIELDIKREEVFLKHPVTGEEFDGRVQQALRIHPYTNDTEGFFVAKIRKPA